MSFIPRRLYIYNSKHTMAPGIITPVTTPPNFNGTASSSDVDLTSLALRHKLLLEQQGMAANNNGGKELKTTTSSTKYAELDASRLIYHLTQSPRPFVPPDATATAASGLGAGETICTDHMVLASWDAATGWAAPELKPYGPLSLMPTASVLHYATECFEGLKAYRGVDGRLRLFRPDCNARRFLASATRIALPAFPPDQVERLLVALMAVDGAKWLPRDRPGAFLYLRPTLIGTSPQLGVQVPRQALLYVTASFMPPMDQPPGGMGLHTSPEDMVRAWVGGFGYAKLGANYGPSLLATAEARSRGFGQVLWLYGPEGYCTEAGASNFFVVWECKDTGRTQLVTAPLDDRLILDGVTRRSLLQLARERLGHEIEVVERRYTIGEVLEASKEGRMVEAFAAGTAVSFYNPPPPVSLLDHNMWFC